MIKVIRKLLDAKIAAWFKSHHPEYKKAKLSLGHTGFSGCNVYLKELDAARKAWIVIGGSASSSSLTAVLYWTTEGVAWDALGEWDTRKQKTPPPTGGVQLTEEPVVGNDLPLDGRRLLLVEEPPRALLDAAFDAYSRSELFQKVRAMTAKEMRQKNPAVSEREIDAAHLGESRRAFTTWWDVERNLTLDDAVLSPVLSPLLEKVVYLFETYGIPFLEARLASSANR